MSRHRNIRGLRIADEDYDDVYGHSLEEECISPTSQQFLYHRGTTNNQHWITPQERDENQQILADIVDGVRQVLGDAVPEEDIVALADECDHQIPKIIDTILQKRETTDTSQPLPTDKPFVPFLPKEKRVEPAIKIVTAGGESKKPRVTLGFKVEEQPIGKKADKDESVTPRAASSSPLPPSNVSPSPAPPPANQVKRDAAALFESERSGEKEQLCLVVIGHVDAGKSTLVGRLLCEAGQISQRLLHKYEQESKKIGKQSFMYAWLLDETGEERARGITMDLGTASFSTPTKNITVLDAPGHADFIPKMITGAGQANAALLVVDATRGEFETGFDLGGQTREHALLVRSLGVSQLGVAVNKLDTADWSRERFDSIREQLKIFLKQAGFKDADVSYVPCSGLSGENLLSLSAQCPLREWYDGPTLMDVLDKFVSPERPISKPLRITIDDVFKGVNSGLSISGKVETGAFKVGDKIAVCPTKEFAIIKSVSIDEVSKNAAFAGDLVTLTLSGVDVQNISVGFVLSDPIDLIPVASRFEARIVIFNVKVPITKGFPVVLHHQFLVESANIVKLTALINKSTGEIIKNKPRCLGNNSVATVEIEVCRPICIETYKDFKELGRVTLRVSGVTIAAGLITAIL